MVQEQIVSSEKTNKDNGIHREELIEPEIRFPEFNDEWITHKLGDISKIQRGASPRPISDKKWYDTENKRVGWVRIGDVTSSFKFLDKTEDYFSEEGIKKSRFLPKGSLIMSICATIGKPIITNMDVCIHDGFIGFSELNDVNEEFLYYNLNILENKFCSLGQTGSQANLNSDLVRKTEINIPSLKEQEKIVNFLSKIDKKIELLEKKLVLYQQLEKEVRTSIFSFKNDKIQFKKFLLGEIAEIKKGFTPSTQNDDYWNDGDYLWLSIADMNKKYLTETSKKITEKAVINKRITPKNTLVMSFKLTIGKLAILKKDMFTNEAIASFYWKNDKISTEYMYFYLKSINIKKYGSQAAKGITLNNETLNSIPVYLPNMNTQKEIVEILLSFNNKIELIKTQIRDMNKFKKGLLQKMFI